MAVSGTGTDDSSLGYCCARYRYRWFIVTRWWLYPLQEQMISHWVVAVPVTSTGDSSLGDGCTRYRNRWFVTRLLLCPLQVQAIHRHQVMAVSDTGADDKSQGCCCARYKYRWCHQVIAVPVTGTGNSSSLGDGCIRYRNRCLVTGLLLCPLQVQVIHRH